MNKFERYLIDNGMRVHGAARSGRIVDKFLLWCKVHELSPSRLKRSHITAYLQYNKEQGNSESTIANKENVLRHYYQFLGTKRNPAKNWLRKRKRHTLPPHAMEMKELMTVYTSLKPRTATDHRDRCMLGLVLFQGLLRSELWELRIKDIDFTGSVFVQGQLRTNSRRLKLEPAQMMHLHEYLQKYRNEMLIYKKDKTNDRLFLAKGQGEKLDNINFKILKRLRQDFPQIIDFRHIRASVITNWEKQEGIIEAMHKAGHRYISSTARYQTEKYQELQDMLKCLHPMEKMKI